MVNSDEDFIQNIVMDEFEEVRPDTRRGELFILKENPSESVLVSRQFLSSLTTLMTARTDSLAATIVFVMLDHKRNPFAYGVVLKPEKADSVTRVMLNALLDLGIPIFMVPLDNCSGIDIDLHENNPLLEVRFLLRNDTMYIRGDNGELRW